MGRDQMKMGFNWTYVFVLIRCHSNEVGFIEHFRLKVAPDDLAWVVRPDEVETRHVLVHGVQNSLQRD